MGLIPKSNCSCSHSERQSIPIPILLQPTDRCSADSIQKIQFHYSGTLLGFRRLILGTDLTFVRPAALIAATHSALPRHLIAPYFRIPLGVLARRNVISSSIPQSSSAISEKPSSSSGIFLPWNRYPVVSTTKSSLPDRL